METNGYDVIVLGAGIVGSSTAYHLQQDGCKVLLLEQFPLTHTRGSSHGHSRLLRRAYPKGHEIYTRMTSDAIEMWRTLEKESGMRLYNEVGVLSVGFDPKLIDEAQKTLAQEEIPHRKLSNAQLCLEFPMLRTPRQATAIREKEGGILYADKCGQAFRKVFLARGGTIKDNQKVTKVVPGDQVKVYTQDDVYTGLKLVVTAGPWTNKILKPLGSDLPLQPWRISVLYWKEKNPGMFSSDHFPCLRFIRQIEHEGVKHNIYCTPSDEYRGFFKLCLHKGASCDPDIRDAENNEFDVKLLSKFVSTWMPELEAKPAITERCIYTMSADEGYILDKHPRWSNIIVGAGFSGHGFKTAPVSGRILADITTAQPSKYDLKPFKWDRFVRPPIKSSL